MVCSFESSALAAGRSTVASGQDIIHARPLVRERRADVAAIKSTQAMNCLFNHRHRRAGQTLPRQQAEEKSQSGQHQRRRREFPPLACLIYHFEKPFDNRCPRLGA
jgi:hypothetical protein